MSLLCLSLLLSPALTTATATQEAPAHYKFSYHVRDELTGQDFGQEEERTGTNPGGEYRVSLPDGRKQIVTYTVTDPLSGYIADVSYQGFNRQYYSKLGDPIIYFICPKSLLSSVFLTQ